VTNQPQVLATLLTEKSPWYSPNRTEGGLQNWSGHFGDKTIFTHARTRTLYCPTCRLPIIPTIISQLSCSIRIQLKLLKMY